MAKTTAAGEEGTTTVKIFVANHNFGLDNYEYRLNGNLIDKFRPFIKVAKKGSHRIGIWVGTERNPILLKNADLIRYRRVR